MKAPGWLAVVIGLIVWAAVGSAGLFVLGVTWPAYATAAPPKAFTLPMLIARLCGGGLASIASGWTAARSARTPAVTWWVGGIVLLVSLPIHLISVWADYPVWYHTAYLLTIVPLVRAGATLRDER